MAFLANPLPPLAGQIIVKPPPLPTDVVDGRSALAGNGASLVAAHACPDLLAPERVDALMVLVFLHLHELGAKDTESHLTVLELRNRSPFWDNGFPLRKAKTRATRLRTKYSRAGFVPVGEVGAKP